MKTKFNSAAAGILVVLLLNLISVPPRAQAQGGVPLWTNLYSGPTNSYSAAIAVAVDGSGNLFVTGYSAIGNGSDSDFVTIKYSNAGAPLWTNCWTAGAGAGPAAIAVDSSGNVFVTGTSIGAGGTYDWVTIKYSNAGVPLWTKYFNGPGNGWDEPCCIAVDTSGNVFVTGESTGIGGYSDYATIKYSNAGVALWTNRYNGPGNREDVARALAVDIAGNVFVAGLSHGGGTEDDYATIKYSNAGVPLWTNRYNGLGGAGDFASRVAVDSNGNVFVTGLSGGSGGFADYATIAYSSGGVPLWTNRYNGPGNSEDQPSGITLDGSGNVFVTGWSQTSSNGGNSDFVTIAYSGTGVPLWTNRFHGPVDYRDAANALAVDGNGNVFVTGAAQTSSNSTTGDFVTIKYSSVSPPAPSLAIQRMPTNTVVISWPSPSTGFVLQQNTNRLGSVNWSNVTATANDNGTNRFIIVNPAGNRFYRLFKP